jgi:predicted permease
VSYSDQIPLWFGVTPWHQLEVEGHVPAGKEDMNIHRSLVPQGYFGLMRIPVLEGRDFAESDDESGAPVIIVNETFARRFFGEKSPVGRKVKVEGQWTTVVGLVKNCKYHHPAEAPLAYFYRPFRQVFSPGLNFSMFVKTAGDPMQLVETVRREAVALNPDAGVFSARLLSESTSASLYPQKVAASLLAALGVLSLLLAAAGLYSVMSYAVSQRTHEVGIRMALGARPGDVIGMVLYHGMGLTVVGLAAGITIAALAARFAGSMLVDVSPADPATFVGMAVFLGLFALAANFVPARRATKVDPMTALRFQ